jgi:hypothetical protein
MAKPQGEANEIVRAYRSTLIERGLSPSTINRRLSALRSLVALGKELGFVTFDLATRNVRSEAYRDTRGPEPDAMAALIQAALAHPHRAKAARDVAAGMISLDWRPTNPASMLWQCRRDGDWRCCAFGLGRRTCRLSNWEH